MAIFIEKPREIRFLTFLPSIIAGVILAIYLPKGLLENYILIATLPFLIFLFWILAFIKLRSISATWLFFLSTHVIVLIFFIFRTTVFTNQIISFKISKNQEIRYSGKVKEIGTSNEFYQKLVVEVDKIENGNGNGNGNGNKIKVLLKLKNSAEISLTLGDHIYGIGNISQIEANKNPHTFDAKWYYKTQNILYQIKSEAKYINKIKIDKSTLHIKAKKSQQYLSEILKSTLHSDEVYGLMNALLLGNKTYLLPSTIEAFRNTGAAHILAVSGLHLGIVFIMLYKLLGSIKRGSWPERIVKLLCYLILLWTYAFITGLSPSVCRAATMISIVLIGHLANRKSSIWNAIGLSACILLIYNPLYIFQIGFQLSYGALMGIVLFGKSIFKLFLFKHKLFSYLWGIVSVSIAAQVFILPICVFYFHQIPIMSLLSSIIGIPAATILVMAGIALLIFNSIEFLKLVIAEIIEFTAKHLINSLEFLAQFQPPSLSTLFISSITVALILLSLSLGIWFLNSKKQWVFISLIICCAFTSISSSVKFQKNKNYQGLIIYHSYQSPTIELFSNHTSFLFTKDTSDNNYIPNEALKMKFGIDTSVMLNFNEAYESELFYKRNAHILIGDTQIVFVDRNLIIHEELFLLSNNLIFWISDIQKIKNKSLDIPASATIVLDNTIPPWDHDKLTDFKIKYTNNIYDISAQGAFIKQLNIKITL